MKFVTKLHIALLFLIVSPLLSNAQNARLNENNEKITSGSFKLDAVWCTPNYWDSTKAVLIIAGSGPTDKDGNQPNMKNDALKQMAHRLAEFGIASMRYDKRSVQMIQRAKEAPTPNVVFEDFVHDAEKAYEAIQSKGAKQIYIAGHSQGSVIGMLVGQQHEVAGFISLSGPARPINAIISDQLVSQYPLLKDSLLMFFDNLRNNEPVKTANLAVQAVFNGDNANFIKTWMAYDPSKELKKVKSEKLIVNGDTDIQVSIEDANLLAKAVGQKPVIISGMNHVLKEAPADKFANMVTYNRPDLPIKMELIMAMVKFINKPEE